MPFIGRDWRSPGEQWVRTSEGWERMKQWRVKIFENLNENAVARIRRLSLEEYDLHEVTSRRQPHIYFNHGGTREKSESTTFSEALVQLDMAGAVKDIRRANYVFHMMCLILKDKLSSLSGTSQKLIFGILESMVNEAIKTEFNYGGIRDLLNYAHDALSASHYSDSGSHTSWTRHMNVVEHLSQKLSDYELKERQGDGKALLQDLPIECLRIIFSQIPDHEDVLRAGQANMNMNHISKDGILWKQMCLFHFTENQVLIFLPKDETNKNIDWEHIYKRCYKRFGKKDVFADTLAICSHCCSIHWKDLGHPCVSEQAENSRLLSPKDFLILFKFQFSN